MGKLRHRKVKKKLVVWSGEVSSRVRVWTQVPGVSKYPLRPLYLSESPLFVLLFSRDTTSKATICQCPTEGSLRLIPFSLFLTAKDAKGPQGTKNLNLWSKLQVPRSHRFCIALLMAVLQVDTDRPSSGKLPLKRAYLKWWKEQTVPEWKWAPKSSR